MLPGLAAAPQPAIPRLQRAVAREILTALTGECTIPQYADLRPARRAKNITLTAAAADYVCGLHESVNSNLGRRRHDNLAAAYRTGQTPLDSECEHQSPRRCSVPIFRPSGARTNNRRTPLALLLIWCTIS